MCKSTDKYAKIVGIFSCVTRKLFFLLLYMKTVDFQVCQMANFGNCPSPTEQDGELSFHRLLDVENADLHAYVGRTEAKVRA